MHTSPSRGQPLLRLIPGLAAVGILGAGVIAQSASAKPATPAPAAPIAPASAAPILAPLKVIVSIAPLKGLIEPLLPIGSSVQVLIPPGVSEHGYEIPPGKLAAMTSADLVVLVGMGLEPQVEKSLAAAGKPARIVVRMEDVPAIKAAAKPKADGHDHHDHDDHDHDHHHASDPHAWLDPMMAKALCEFVAAKITPATLPADAPEATIAAVSSLKAKTAQHIKRTEQTDAKIKGIVDAAQRKTIVVGHDAFGWLAQRYGLTVIPITGLTAGEPKPDDLRKATQAVKEHGLTTIFIEPQLSSAAAERIAQITGAKVDVLDPLGNGDWFDLMDRNAEALRKALGQKAKPSETPAKGPPSPKP